MPVASVRERIDALQQRHVALSFPYAVHKRFNDDQGRHLAALISYYGFFSLFPLLLAFVSVIGIVLRGNPDLQQDVIDSALGQLPVLGTQLSFDGAGLSGSGWALAIGVGTAIWAGLGVVYAVQDAMNTMWDVPRHERPGFVAKRVRGLAMLLVLALSLVVGSAVTAIATQLDDLGRLARLATLVGTVAVNSASLLVSFWLLTVARPRWRTLLPGAITGGIALVVVQTLGTWYLTRVVKGASDTYGTFALVIGLLTWLALLARVVLYAAEINVVLALKLWPRTMRDDDPLNKAV
jgi:inner membrane protein YhjD